MPLGDVGQQVLALLAMYVSNGYTLYDDYSGCLGGKLEPFIRTGVIQDTPEMRFALSHIEQVAYSTVAMELALICQNIVLMLQAIGLGGCIRAFILTACWVPSLMKASGASVSVLSGARIGSSPIRSGSTGTMSQSVPRMLPICTRPRTNWRSASSGQVARMIGTRGAHTGKAARSKRRFVRTPRRRLIASVRWLSTS